MSFLVKKTEDEPKNAWILGGDDVQFPRSPSPKRDGFFPLSTQIDSKLPKAKEPLQNAKLHEYCPNLDDWKKMCPIDGIEKSVKN